jgi:hypothetical protein
MAGSPLVSDYAVTGYLQLTTGAHPAWRSWIDPASRSNATAIAGDPVGDAHLLLTEAELHAETRAFRGGGPAARRAPAADCRRTFRSSRSPGPENEAARARVRLIAPAAAPDYGRTPLLAPLGAVRPDRRLTLARGDPGHG